jgi:hypothetical protein
MMLSSYDFRSKAKHITFYLLHNYYINIYLFNFEGSVEPIIGKLKKYSLSLLYEGQLC